MQRQSSGAKPLANLRKFSESRAIAGSPTGRAAAARQAQREEIAKRDRQRAEALAAIDRAIHGDAMRKVEGFRPAAGLGDVLRASMKGKK